MKYIFEETGEAISKRLYDLLTDGDNVEVEFKKIYEPDDYFIIGGLCSDFRKGMIIKVIGYECGGKRNKIYYEEVFGGAPNNLFYSNFKEGSIFESWLIPVTKEEVDALPKSFPIKYKSVGGEYEVEMSSNQTDIFIRPVDESQQSNPRYYLNKEAWKQIGSVTGWDK